jgi:hypothetical protein
LVPSTTKAGNILEGETWYYSFGVRFPAGFPTLENSHCSAAQWFGGGRQELGLACSGANNPPPHTQVLAISSPPEGGWTAPLQKGQGWHMFVMKVFHHDDPTKGRLSLLYKPPGARRYSKLINNHATSTWNARPGRMYHKIGYYRGAQDPPWGRAVDRPQGHDHVERPRDRVAADTCDGSSARRLAYSTSIRRRGSDPSDR